MPAILGRRGIIKAVPIDLDEREKQKLHACAETLRKIAKDADEEVKKVQDE